MVIKGNDTAASYITRLGKSKREGCKDEEGGGGEGRHLSHYLFSLVEN